MLAPWRSPARCRTRKMPREVRNLRSSANLAPVSISSEHLFQQWVASNAMNIRGRFHRPNTRPGEALAENNLISINYNRSIVIIVSCRTKPSAYKCCVIDTFRLSAGGGRPAASRTFRQHRWRAARTSALALRALDAREIISLRLQSRATQPARGNRGTACGPGRPRVERHRNSACAQCPLMWPRPCVATGRLSAADVIRSLRLQSGTADKGDCKKP